MLFQEIVTYIEKEAVRLKELPGPALTNEKPCLHKKVDINKLLQLDTPHFVEGMYLEIMGRPGDEGGLAHFNNLLNTNAITREDLIVEIRKSPEGMAYCAHLKGLPMKYRKEAWKWKTAELTERLREIKHIMNMR